MSDQPTTNGMFPQARLDEMSKAAQDFDPRNLPKSDWDLTGPNFDSSTSAFVARQLEFLRPGIFEVQYPGLKGKSLVPINSSMDPGAEQWTIQVVDRAGQVKLLKDFAKDLGRVDITTTQKSMGVFSMGISYAYTINEARHAMYARMPIQARKAMAARDLMARKLDEILFIGEATTGAKGLINQSGTETYTPTADGTGGSKLWSTKSADKICNDLNAPFSQIIVNSLEVHTPDTLVLPLSRLQYIGGLRVGDGTSESVLSYWLRTNPYGIRSVEQTTRLETAGAGSTARGLVYQKSPQVLEAIVPIEFEQFAPETLNTEVVTICHMRVGGVAVYYPKAICYFDAF
jgi:hypothetical protein